MKKISGGYIVTDDEMDARDIQIIREAYERISRLITETMHKDLILTLHEGNLTFQVFQDLTGIPRSTYEEYCKELGIVPRD